MHTEGRESVQSMEEEERLPVADEVTETEATETSTEEATSDDKPIKETARQTVERVLREAKSKPSDGAESASAEEKTKSIKDQPLAKKDDEKVKPLEDSDPDLSPPARLKARQKEMFNNLPKGLKRALNETVREVEGVTTRAAQEYAKATQQVRGIVDAVQPFAAEWGEQGFTVPSAIAALASAHRNLTNPETQVKTFLKMGRDMGLDFDELAQIAKGGTTKQGATPPDISNHPAFRDTQAQLESVLSWKKNLEAQQQQGVVTSIVSELETVRNEKDQSGRYLYPEMHDDAFIEHVKPLVSALKGNTPGLSYGEAFKRAYFSVTGKYPNASIQPSQTRLPASENNTNQRAITAAVSVRGRIAPAASAGGLLQDIPQDALRNPRASTEWALNQLRRGG